LERKKIALTNPGSDYAQTEELVKYCPEIDVKFEFKEPFLHMNLPECGDVVKPRFILYYKKNHCELDPLNLPNEKTTKCAKKILKSKQITTVVAMTHGFTNNIKSEWMKNLTNEILKSDPKVAVLKVGWGHGSGALPKRKILYYYQAASNTRYVGAVIGRVMEELKKLAKKDFSRDIAFHCIGHSLGAHVCGFVGKHIKQHTDYKLRRISGLDPAGPLFTTDVPFPFSKKNVSEGSRLNKDDASIVDILHTDGKRTDSTLFQYGTMVQLGDIDFYAGGDDQFGHEQPGCRKAFGVMDVAGCSHQRAPQLYIESVHTRCPAFKKCDDINSIPHECDEIKKSSLEFKPKMGYFLDGDFSDAIYTVSTTEEKPFCSETQ